jgi:hypothetical protein
MPSLTPSSNTQPLAVAPRTAATLLGSTESSLEKDRAKGHLGIPYVKAGKRVIYRLSDLDQWLTANRTTPEKQGGSHE